MRKIGILLAFVLWAVVPKAAYATAQIPDILIVGKDTLDLICNPLEGYFDETHPRPNWEMLSTACWRGYQACFEIRSDSLFLLGIQLGKRGDSTHFYPLDKLFGDKATPKGVFSYWVDGTILCRDGRLLYYVHMGYNSIYEYNIEYEIQKGKVKKRRIGDNRKSFIPYGSENDVFSLLKTFVETKIDYSQLDQEDMDDQIPVYVKKVNGKGHIKKVTMSGASPKQERAILRALKKVPRFNVLYFRGKPVQNLSWHILIQIYANEEERDNQYPTKGPDVGEWDKQQLMEGDDYIQNLKALAKKYHWTYEDWKSFSADTSATAKQYRDYFCKLYGDPMLYQNHYFMTLGDSALKYYYQYWDETDEHQELYATIVELEQELGRAHNPKIVESKNPEFQYLVFPEEMDKSHQADSEYVSWRCRQVSYHLRGFGEGDLHETLPPGVQEEWRFLLLRGDYVRKESPVLVKVVSDGREARIIWRVAKETQYERYPGLDHFRHGIQSEGERTLTEAELKQFLELANAAGIDTLYLDNNFFTSPPTIYNLEHRTTTGYSLVNDYDHLYYKEETSPLFQSFMTLCKYLLFLADPTLKFDIDD